MRSIWGEIGTSRNLPDLLKHLAGVKPSA